MTVDLANAIDKGAYNNGIVHGGYDSNDLLAITGWYMAVFLENLNHLQKLSQEFKLPVDAIDNAHLMLEGMQAFHLKFKAKMGKITPNSPSIQVPWNQLYNAFKTPVPVASSREILLWCLGNLDSVRENMKKSVREEGGLQSLGRYMGREFATITRPKPRKVFEIVIDPRFKNSVMRFVPSVLFVCTGISAPGKCVHEYTHIDANQDSLYSWPGLHRIRRSLRDEQILGDSQTRKWEHRMNVLEAA